MSIAEPTRFHTLIAPAVPATTEFPLDPASGEGFDEAELGPGRLSVALIHGRAPEPRILFVVALDGRPPADEGQLDPEAEVARQATAGGWSVGFELTSGQLHRLTNALAGRGRRLGVRPRSVDGEYVHVGGSPELLTVEYGDVFVEIPAGPGRALSWTLRALETGEGGADDAGAEGGDPEGEGA